jgi:hypothetical protein
LLSGRTQLTLAGEPLEFIAGERIGGDRRRVVQKKWMMMSATRQGWSSQSRLTFGDRAPRKIASGSSTSQHCSNFMSFKLYEIIDLKTIHLGNIDRNF